MVYVASRLMGVELRPWRSSRVTGVIYCGPNYERRMNKVEMMLEEVGQGFSRLDALLARQVGVGTQLFPDGSSTVHPSREQAQ